MSAHDEELLRRLLPIFREEARERVAAISSNLKELGRAAGEERASVVEVMFREAHSLKASARAVGQSDIELVCQSLESLFAAVKRGGMALSPAILETLQAAADALEDLAPSIDAAPDAARSDRATQVSAALEAAILSFGTSGNPAPESEIANPPALDISEAPPAPREEVRSIAPEVATASEALREIARAPSAPPTPSAPPQPAPTTETVRLSVQRLNAVLLQTEEMLGEKLAAHRRTEELRGAANIIAEWKRERAKLAPATRQLRTVTERYEGADGPRGTTQALLPAQVQGFLEWSDARIDTLEAALAETQGAAAAEAHGLGLKVDALLYAMKQVLTLPCGSLLQVFPRMVRNIARDQGKEVDFVIRGSELEIDRRILDELKDPLLHLVRNCVDHGVEMPAHRAAAGKPPRATVSLGIAAVEGDKVEFVVSDDGAGIAVEKLAAAAAKLGLLKEDREGQRDVDLLPLVFQSGLSTSPIVTDLSGRGLGLAIVREKVERLGGAITVESEKGRGTAFRLTVPLTLATFRGITARVADRLFMLPTHSVERVTRVKRAAISTVKGRRAIDVAGLPVPLVRLCDVLGIDVPPQREVGDAWVVVVVLEASSRRVAFEVDAVEGDQEILVKPLGRCLVRVPNVQGAAILPTGTIAPILNAHDLLKSASGTAAAQARAPVPRREAAVQKCILVAEDSITARALLKSILEAAGYRVRTAVDGLEAWSMLQLERVDLLVSDVEMPRMNGFELTARIRADRNLSELPVVLVTALESREHIERGVEVGANAYIQKGGFEQSRLLEAVQRLV